jgi:hypothetical protein
MHLVGSNSPLTSWSPPSTRLAPRGQDGRLEGVGDVVHQLGQVDGLEICGETMGADLRGVQDAIGEAVEPSDLPDDELAHLRHRLHGRSR